MGGLRERLRTARLEITDEMWHRATRNCKVADASDLLLRIFSNALGRREVLELTSALKSSGGKRFVNSILAHAVEDKAALDPDPMEDAEVLKFLEIPIVDKWTALMPIFEPQVREAGVKWAAECIDRTALP